MAFISNAPRRLFWRNFADNLVCGLVCLFLTTALDNSGIFQYLARGLAISSAWLNPRYLILCLCSGTGRSAWGRWICFAIIWSSKRSDNSRVLTSLLLYLNSEISWLIGDAYMKGVVMEANNGGSY